MEDLHPPPLTLGWRTPRARLKLQQFQLPLKIRK
jgi:hypothetical protein